MMKQDMELAMPDPVSTSLTMSYKLSESISSAYVMISQPYGMSYSYPLNVESDNIVIDLSSFTPGLYNVILICEGMLADATSITKL